MEVSANRKQTVRGDEGVENGTTQQYVSFTLGDEEYGIDIMCVREIRAWTETTSLPNSPEFVRGVINLRGTIVPIFDLRARFAMSPVDPTKTHVVVIVKVGSRTVGILVDAVSDILTVSKADIQPVPEMDRTVDDAYLEGILSVDTRMVALIALDKLIGNRTLSAADSFASGEIH